MGRSSEGARSSEGSKPRRSSRRLQRRGEDGQKEVGRSLVQAGVGMVLEGNGWATGVRAINPEHRVGEFDAGDSPDGDEVRAPPLSP